MFEISSVNKRFFGIKLISTDDDGEQHKIELEVEPPKVKDLKRLIAVQKVSDETAMDELTEAVRKMLSKNKSRCNVPMDYIDDLDFDQLQEILTAYFDWLVKEKNSPN